MCGQLHTPRIMQNHVRVFDLKIYRKLASEEGEWHQTGHVAEQDASPAEFARKSAMSSVLVVEPAALDNLHVMDSTPRPRYGLLAEHLGGKSWIQRRPRNLELWRSFGTEF